MLRTVFQANEWLAIKRLRGKEHIEEAVDAWDTSVLSGNFKFMQKILLDDLDAAIPMAREQLKHEDLALDTLFEWPALDELRQHPRFHELLPASREAEGDAA
jgi:hypothetical protein